MLVYKKSLTRIFHTIILGPRRFNFKTMLNRTVSLALARTKMNDKLGFVIFFLVYFIFLLFSNILLAALSFIFFFLYLIVVPFPSPGFLIFLHQRKWRDPPTNSPPSPSPLPLLTVKKNQTDVF